MFWRNIIKKRKKIHRSNYTKEELLEKFKQKGFVLHQSKENIQILMRDDGISVEKIIFSLKNKQIKYKHLIRQRGNKKDNSLALKQTIISFELLQLLNYYVKCLENEKEETNDY